MIIIKESEHVLLSMRGYNKPSSTSSSVKEFANPIDEASTILSVICEARDRMAARPNPELDSGDCSGKVTRKTNLGKYTYYFLVLGKKLSHYKSGWGKGIPKRRGQILWCAQRHLQMYTLRV